MSMFLRSGANAVGIVQRWSRFGGARSVALFAQPVSFLAPIHLLVSQRGSTGGGGVGRWSVQQRWETGAGEGVTLTMYEKLREDQKRLMKGAREAGATADVKALRKEQLG